MLCVYQPSTPIKAAIVYLDLADQPGEIDVEHLAVLGVQAVENARPGERPAVRHELIAWCPAYETPRPLLDVVDTRRGDLPAAAFLTELVVTAVPPEAPGAFESAVQLAKARLQSEFERRQPSVVAVA